jgi:phage-related tail fiber protein
MLWYDTAENTLYMRSEADDAWIKLGELDQSNLTFAPENAVPSGAVVYLARSTAPDGWLKANGAAVSRTTYARLFGAIGTTFGSGDGSTTFTLPDLRGEFMRGWDDGRGIDSGRAFGSFQNHAMQRIEGRAGGVRNDFSGGLTGPFFTTRSLADLSRGGANFAEVRFDNNRVANTAAENRPRNRALLACIKF